MSSSSRRFPDPGPIGRPPRRALLRRRAPHHRLNIPTLRQTRRPDRRVEERRHEQGRAALTRRDANARDIMDFLDLAGPNELVVFEEGVHVCNNVPYRSRALAADWLAEQLGVAE